MWTPSKLQEPPGVSHAPEMFRTICWVRPSPTRHCRACTGRVWTPAWRGSKVKGVEARYEGILKKEEILASLRGKKDESHVQGYSDGTGQRRWGWWRSGGPEREDQGHGDKRRSPMQTEAALPVLRTLSCWGQWG